MRKRIVRKSVPLGFVFFAAASTGTLLASDNCGVSLVQRLTDATRAVQQHTGPAHKHTQETLAKWQVWGEEYLAKHGHPYEPPKRKQVASQPPDQQNANFQFLCDLPPVPEDVVYETALLEPGPMPPVLDDVPEVTVGQIPPAVVPPATTPTAGPPDYPAPPLYEVPIGGVPVPPAKTPTTPTTPDQPTTPTTPVIPVGVTPEPGTFALFGTGMAAVMGLRRRMRRAEDAGTN